MMEILMNLIQMGFEALSNFGFKNNKNNFFFQNFIQEGKNLWKEMDAPTKIATGSLPIQSQQHHSNLIHSKNINLSNNISSFFFFFSIHRKSVAKQRKFTCKFLT